MNSKRSVEFINDWLTVGDVKGRPVLTVTRLNTEILRMLGVAYVISEQQLSVSPNITLVKNVSGMFLYRLRDPNLGNYSPTRVVSTAESGAASAVLGINPVEQVITNSELPRLSRAKTTSLSLRPGHVRVSVATSATSLVILPIEISGCMRIVSGDVSATLVRVNGLLAGLLVSKSGDYEVVDGRPAIAPTSCFYASARS